MSLLLLSVMGLAGMVQAHPGHEGNEGRFSVERHQGRDWFRGPDGKRFLSLGVCVVDQGTPKKNFDPKNPSYASFQHYKDGGAWAGDTVGRLQSWHFNTIGAWSDFKPIRPLTTKGLYFMPILHMGSSAGAPWQDMWDPKVVELVDHIARDQILAFKGDPRVVGYFSDNEMGWWEAGLFEWGWKAKPGSGTRTRLVDLLQSRYHGSWKAFEKDFEATEAGSFKDLRARGKAWLKAGGNGMATVQDYVTILADRYYSLCKSVLRKYAPQALFLGDRYISNFYPEVAAVAGKYVDVLSTNLNADWNDGTFARFFLPELERITHKPILISEYYMSAKENGSGNKNDSSGFPVVQTQRERAAGFAKQTRFFLEHPYVVGAHWFQYSDEAQNGRGDGENYNMGLIDIHNRPYAELTGAATRLKPEAIHVAGRPRTAVSGVVPRAPTVYDDLGRWNRAEGYVKSVGESPRGDLYMSWSPGALNVAVYWNEDRFAETYYRTGRIPAVDRPKIQMKIDGQSFIAVGGEGGTPVCDGRIKIVSSKTGVRNQLILRIPATVLGRKGLKPGDRVAFDVKLSTRARAYKQRWQGKSSLR